MLTIEQYLKKVKEAKTVEEVNRVAKEGRDDLSISILDYVILIAACMQRRYDVYGNG